MINPYETLGLKPWASPDEIRSAYRALVKQVHPDHIQDPEARKLAQERMVAINLAYKEALRLSTPRATLRTTPSISGEEAIRLAEKLLSRDKPDHALRQLLRTEERNAAWYAAQGRALMSLRQFESAHQSFRQAIRQDPENRDYRRQALDAILALRREKTLPGRIRKAFRQIIHK